MSKTYNLLFTPNLPESESIDYVCSDNKIHIRVKDYLNYEVIRGFEKKLTYLITYLINTSFKTSISEKNPSHILKEFLKSDEVNEITNTINSNIANIKFKGIKIKTNYNKKDCLQYPFGNINLDYFPILADKGSLQIFLKTFKISLKDYLFDDRYIVILSDLKYKSDCNIKFKNKEIKKQSFDEDSDFIELW